MIEKIGNNAGLVWNALCGGYAVGYNVIQAYLKKTGISIKRMRLISEPRQKGGIMYKV